MNMAPLISLVGSSNRRIILYFANEITCFEAIWLPSPKLILSIFLLRMHSDASPNILYVLSENSFLHKSYEFAYVVFAVILDS